MEKAKPFLKWPGGKTNLISQLKEYLPVELANGKITTYIEPFIGGGSLFYYIKNHFQVKKSIINDVNKELMLSYKVVQNDLTNLFKFLERYQKEYISLDEADRKKYFYDFRDHFNAIRFDIDYENYSEKWVCRAAQVIFLNKTCFNGLFRFNKQGEFNTPYGSYKNPKIFNPENLTLVHHLLENTEITCFDFEEMESYVEPGSFVYLDPPYRPLNKTSSFTSYSSGGFEDDEQRRLARFYRKTSHKNAKLMLSNSEPKNENPEDAFFEKIYQGFNIDTVYAPRMINCKGDKRGKIKEIVVTNYSCYLNP